MTTAYSRTSVHISVHLILLLLIFKVLSAEDARSSKRVVYPPFRREVSPKSTEIKSTSSLDYASIQQTPVEPELRLGM